jgi:hypothetical protein
MRSATEPPAHATPRGGAAVPPRGGPATQLVADYFVVIEPVAL